MFCEGGVKRRTQHRGIRLLLPCLVEASTLCGLEMLAVETVGTIS
jgi:hypothetical protein